jgi:hypothetical protein
MQKGLSASKSGIPASRRRSLRRFHARTMPALLPFFILVSRSPRLTFISQRAIENKTSCILYCPVSFSNLQTSHQNLFSLPQKLTVCTSSNFLGQEKTLERAEIKGK